MYIHNKPPEKIERIMEKGWIKKSTLFIYYNMRKCVTAH